MTAPEASTPAKAPWHLWVIGVWGGVVGMLLLLVRKRAAVPVLLASLAGYWGDPPSRLTGQAVDHGPAAGNRSVSEVWNPR